MTEVRVSGGSAGRFWRADARGRSRGVAQLPPACCQPPVDPTTLCSTRAPAGTLPSSSHGYTASRSSLDVTRTLECFEPHALKLGGCLAEIAGRSVTSTPGAGRPSLALSMKTRVGGRLVA